MGHIRRVFAVLAVALVLGAIGVRQSDLILAARTVLPSPSSVESGEASKEAPVAASLALSKANVTATLSLNAPADPVTVGETFTVTVTVGVSDLSEPLAAFQFDLGYDSTILRFVRMEAGGGLRATGRSVVCPNPAPLGSPTVGGNGGVGVRLACATTGDPPGITAPGDPSTSSGQALAVLTFVGLADGQSDLTLSAIKLPTDARPPALIGDVTPQDASVTVGAACTAATLTIGFVTAEPAGSVDLAAQVSNTAGAQVPAGLPVAFYLGDPQAGGTLIGTAATTQALAAGASEVVTVTWTGETPGDHTITIVANDPSAGSGQVGTGSGPVGLCSPPAPVQQTVSILDVPLVESWNLMSSYVNPFTPDVSVVQRSIAGQYAVIQSFDGGALSYYPDLPAEVNTLKEMEAEYGYWVKVKLAGEEEGTEGTAPLGARASRPPEGTGPGSAGVPPARGELGALATLRVVGEKLAEDHPLELAAGWNLVSYLPRQPLPVTTALQSIDGQYSAVLGFEGGALSYYPDLDPSFNTLTTLKPLHGYWIKMTQAGTLQYPASVAGSGLQVEDAQRQRPGIAGSDRESSNLRPSTFQPSTFNTPTPTWVNFYGPAGRPAGSPLPPGTVVQALDPDGVTCGAVEVTTEGQYGLLACYGDDPGTAEDEGAQSGDTVRLVVDGQVLGTGTWTAHGERQWVPLGPVELHRLWLPLLRRGDR